MPATQAIPTHVASAEAHFARRDDLLRQARRFDFRTLHLEENRVARNALIEQAEVEHGMALACVGEGR